ncbi:retrotransposon-related protein [Tanacetum coccineum]
MSQLEFPNFYEDDVKGWMFRIKQFFTLDGVQDGDRIKMVSIYLFDQALTWHLQFIKTQREIVAWDVYEAAILKRIGAVNEDPMAELKNLKYETTMKEYHSQSEKLINQVDITESQAISMFIGGLPASIELNVRMFRPRSLIDAFSLAGLQEVTLAALKQRNAPLLPTPKTARYKYEGQIFTLEIKGQEVDECLEEEEEEESDMIAYELSDQTPQSSLYISLNALLDSGLNKYTVKDKFPIPVIEELIDELQRAQPLNTSPYTYEKELLAVILALQKWKGYLLDRHFKIRTDNFSLKYVLDQRLTTQFQSKWLPKLLGFDYEIEYKNGADNAAVDALLKIERQRVLFSLMAGTSNEVMDDMVATWSKWLIEKEGQIGGGTRLGIKEEASGSFPWIPPTSTILDGICQDISMDFIKSLPMSQGKSALLVVVDRLSKHAHFLPIANPYTALQVAQLEKPKDWVKWISSTEYWYNTNYHTALDTTPYEAVNGQVPLMHIPYVAKDSLVEAIDRTLKQHKLSSKYFGPFQVMARIGKFATIGSFPLSDDEGLLAATPLKLLDRKMVKQNNRVGVFGLIQWSNKNEEDVTWEKLEDIVARFPEFNIDP